MPIVWTQNYAVLPTAQLVEELRPLCADGPLPTFGQPHLWTAPGVGDHDYEGQQQNEFTFLKLVFLAELHRKARDPDGFDGAEALALIKGRDLDEPFFDARWTLEHLGHWIHDQTEALDSALPEDMSAVEGPLRPIRSPFRSVPPRTMRDRWRERVEAQRTYRAHLETFFSTAIHKICRRFEQTQVHVAQSMELELSERLGPEGIRIERSSRLQVHLETGRIGHRRRAEFKLFAHPTHPRGALQARGFVYGEHLDGEWVMELETIERTRL